jgi:hypothetical protein
VLYFLYILRDKYFPSYKSITECWTGAKTTFRLPTLLFWEGDSHWPIYSTKFSGADLGIGLTTITETLLLKIIKSLPSDAGNNFDLEVGEEEYENVFVVPRQNAGKKLVHTYNSEVPLVCRAQTSILQLPWL